MASTEFEKLLKCYRYRDYETAIFLSLHMSKLKKEFTLLTGILLYENNEFTRSIHYLKNINTTTALYYLALNYKKLRKYSEAYLCLVYIADNKAVQDTITNDFINRFVISADDTEFIDSLMGELNILRGRSKIALEQYRKSVFRSPLLKPIMSLFDESISIGRINQFATDPIMVLFENLCKMNIQAKNCLKLEIDIFNISNIKDLCVHHPNVKEYLDEIPGVGSYFASKLAATFCKFGNIQTGLEIFEILRSKDAYFIKDLDVYSTSLWKIKNENRLGLLAKDLIGSDPGSHITWSVIGNYYSFKGLSKESVTCLMKSLRIMESPLAYSLLGFEYISRNQYLDAQRFFKSSICMLENNDKAYFGLGITLGERFDYQNAESYFKKAIDLNPMCMNMKAYLVRFYVRNNKLDMAINHISEYLKTGNDDLEIIVTSVEKRFGTFTAIEDLILCELVDVLSKLRRVDLARRVLSCVESRPNSYFSKKSLIEKVI